LIGKDLRNSAPTDVFYEDALFVVCRFARFRIESMRELDRREIVPALLFQRTVSERILGPDAVVVRV
jgi:hypothetical protein